MSSLSGSNLSKVKLLNKSSIMETIYKSGPISRAAIAEQLSLTPPTITTNVAALIEQGLVKEVENIDGSTEVSLGRKPILIDYIPDSRYAVGIEWGGIGEYYVITDIRGNVIIKHEEKNQTNDYKKIIDNTVINVNKMIEKAGIEKSKIIGVGLGIPGVIETDKGLIRFNPNTGWKNIKCDADLSQRLHLPIAIENNVRVRAISEDLLNKDRRTDVFAYYFILNGIACSLMINGKPLVGGKSGAGEIGHTIAKMDGPLCRCSNRGCLEAIAGEYAIRERCANIIKCGIKTMLSDIAANPQNPTINEILKAVECGDEVITDVVFEALKYLAVSISNIINFINPKLLVIESSITNLDKNRKYILSMIKNNLYAINEDEVRVEFNDFNPYGGAIGGAAYAIKQFFILQKAEEVN